MNSLLVAYGSEESSSESDGDEDVQKTSLHLKESSTVAISSAAVDKEADVERTPANPTKRRRVEAAASLPPPPPLSPPRSTGTAGWATTKDYSRNRAAKEVSQRSLYRIGRPSERGAADPLPPSSGTERARSSMIPPQLLSRRSNVSTEDLNAFGIDPRRKHRSRN